MAQRPHPARLFSTAMPACDSFIIGLCEGQSSKKLVVRCEGMEG